MKHTLLVTFFLLLCFSAAFSQSIVKSEVPSEKGISQSTICKLGQRLIETTSGSENMIQARNSSYKSNPITLSQARKGTTANNGTRAAATYTNIYNGVEYSSDHPYNLNVVYFVANDVPLDPTYQTRLSAILLAGQEFVKQNMIANGYGPKTFGMFTETANPDNVKIILIYGAESLSSYPYDSSGKETAEINAYFNSNPLQKASEHTLIITAVPDQANADVGFYGQGKSCFALDYPQFDIQYLGTNTYEFTKWYGGMMHELGHGLNLPHSHQTNTEDVDPSKGMNLMSAGNYTLGVSPTFINRAGAAILNNNQVFTDAPGIVYYNGHQSGFTGLNVVYNNGNLVLSGTFRSDKPVIDVNIYQHPHDTPSNGGGSEGYDRVAWSVSPAGNTFSVSMPVSELYVTTGPYYLHVELVLQNGETEQYGIPFSYNDGIPEINNIKLTPILLPVPALCDGASPNNAIFSENFESGLGSFTTSHETSSATWETRNWIQTSAPGGRAGRVAFGEDYQGGDCGPASDQTGIIRMESSIISIPAGTAGNLNMAFDHYIRTETPWDGGNIKYSINGNAWTLLPAAAFTANGYNRTLETVDNGNSNPLQGQPAFTGIDDGGNIGSWGQSQIDLSLIGLVAGDDLQLRWEMGTDGCTGVEGWYIDDITIYSCSPLPVTLIKFEGKHIAEGNQLNWTTTSEINNEYFAVERSVNGLNFKEIGKIAGSANSSVINTYKFTDTDFQNGISYYRLKQVDTDGTTAYSRIISVDASNIRDLKFFPNPVESLLTIELPNPEIKSVNVKIINSGGQEILVNKKAAIINGQLHLDLGKLSTGIYQVIITNENRAQNISVLKL